MLHNVSRWLPDQGFFRKLLTLSTGTIAGQALVLLSSPVLTRVYTPEQFGVFAVFATLAGMAAVSVCWRYEFAIPVMHEEDDAATMVALAIVAALITSSVIGFLILFFGEPFARLVEMPALELWLWLLPPAAFVWGIGSALSYWSVRRNTYRINGISRTLQLGSQAGGQMLLGLFGAGAPGLLVGYVTGYLVRAGYFLWRLPGADRRHLARPRKSTFVRLGRSNWRYPALAFPSSLLQAICDLAPALLVAMLYGPAMAGWYALGQRIMGAPVKILSDAASQVFLGEARNLAPGELHRFFLRTLTLFTGLGILGSLPLLLFAPPLFALIFGPEWREAGVIVQILVPLYVARFIVFPVSQVLYIFNRQDMHFLASLLNMLALVLSFSAGALFGLRSEVTLIMFSLGAAASFFFYLMIAWRLARAGTRITPSPS